VDVPVAIPETIPVAEPIVAVAVFTEDHTPPVTVLLSVVVVAGQSTSVPVIAPAFGSGLTDTIEVAAAVPQLLVTV
jgi:hypothetical protein